MNTTQATSATRLSEDFLQYICLCQLMADAAYTNNPQDSAYIYGGPAQILATWLEDAAEAVVEMEGRIRELEKALEMAPSSRPPA